MYEHKSKPLASRSVFLKRLWKNFLFTVIFISLSLVGGTLGYMYFAGLTPVDAFLNASMILSGMGPVVDDPASVPTGGKLFASFYALYSGVAFITNVSILMAPAVHRFFHKLHLEDK